MYESTSQGDIVPYLKHALKTNQEWFHGVIYRWLAISCERINTVHEPSGHNVWNPLQHTDTSDQRSWRHTHHPSADNTLPLLIPPPPPSNTQRNLLIQFHMCPSPTLHFHPLPALKDYSTLSAHVWPPPSVQLQLGRAGESDISTTGKETDKGYFLL